MKNKEAQTETKLHPIIKTRWSPRAFSSKGVEQEKLHRLFEAARWAPSCFNEQPWRFVIGIKDQNNTYTKIFEALAEGNKIWCQNVPVLVALCAKKTFTYNGQPNQWAFYDLGQAAAYITFQAMAEGLYVHQMAGFSAEKIQKAFAIPEDYQPFTVMAIGYLGNPDALPEDLKQSELSKRTRLALNQMVFTNKWNQSAFNE